MSNEVVKYHNDLSKHAFTGMTAGELDLFFVICSKAKEHGGNTVELSFEEIENLVHYKAKNYTRLGQDIVRTNRKLIKQDWILYVEEDEKVVQFTIFDKFETYLGSHKVIVSIREEFQYLLNDLLGNFTRFELNEFVKLKSRYAKEIYRQLKRYRDTGYWHVDILEFRRLLNIPKSYKPHNIDQRVLSPALEELSSIFEYLVVEKVYDKKRGKPLKAFEFHFTPETHWKDDQNVIYDNVPTQTCPDCGKPLIEKNINGVLCWCHSDGWKNSASCKLIFNSIEDINNYKKDSSIADLPPAREENKSWWKKIIGR